MSILSNQRVQGKPVSPKGIFKIGSVAIIATRPKPTFVPNSKCSIAMIDIVEVTHQKVEKLVKNLDAESISRIPTSRNLEVILTKNEANE